MLVTGARGFLGSHVRVALEHLAADVICTTRERRPQRRDWLTCNYSDRADVARVLQRTQPDVVLHLSGFASSELGVQGVEQAIDANVMATYHLMLGVAHECPQARLVTAGTLESADPGRQRPYFFTPYGGSKVMAQLLVQILRDFAELDVTSARIGMTYGPGDPNTRRLVPRLVSSLLTGEVLATSLGDRLEDWIYIDDVVSGLLACAVAEQPLPHSLDVATGQLVPVRHVIEAVHRMLGVTAVVPPGSLPDRPGDQSQADLDRTRRVTGWSPQVTLATGLQHTVDVLVGAMHDGRTAE